MRSLLIPLAMLVPAAAAAEEMSAGQKASILHCGRCHVVPGGNPFGSIGSTPSFRVMRGYENWRDRFALFYEEPPHRAITQIEGLTEPLDPARPSPVAPVTMSEAALEAILDYVETVEPKSVGRVE